MVSKLLERYEAKSLIIFPQNRDAKKFLSAKTFFAFVIDENSAKILAYKLQEEQLEVENEEGYDIIYINDEDINKEVPEGTSIIPSDTPYILRKKIKRKVILADSLFKRVLRKPMEEELEIIKNGTKILDRCFSKTLESIEIGMSEREIADIMDSSLLRQGIDTFAYRTIVVSGKRTSSPLANTTDKEIEKGDVVIIDTSPIYKGYEIGMARTILTEENAEHVKFLQILNRAAREALKYAKIGEKAEKMDTAAREFLLSMNLEYPHYTAMPLGGFYSPYAYPGSEDILENNSVFFLTLGIYRKKFGMRLKHQVFVGEKTHILDSFAVMK